MKLPGKSLFASSASIPMRHVAPLVRAWLTVQPRSQPRSEERSHGSGRQYSPGDSRWPSLLLAVALGLWPSTRHGSAADTTASAPAGKSSPTSQPRVTASVRVREPAVAGLFYPKDPAALSTTLERLLAAAKPEPVSNLKALICPHAGYPYSGPTAAHGYRLLAGQGWRTVIVLAPSHYARFRGASVVGASRFRTPLGEVPVAALATQLAQTPPFLVEAPCAVQRPAWAAQSSRTAPARGEDTPHTWEHADEVQVPFLQKALKDLQIVTVILGEVDPAAVARVLAGHLDDRTLVVASSDLSHYHPYDQAKALDARCVKAVCDLDLEGMRDQEACGQTPILTLMHLARHKGWKARLLDYRNSGDTAGDKSGVVGYAAIAFTGDASVAYSPEERRRLLELARQSVREVVTKGQLPSVRAEQLPARLREPKGSFVTLTKQGALRGCIGNLQPQGPLYASIMDNARSAATRDYRFPRVEPDELDQLELEISVLSEPRPLDFSSPEDLLAKLQPHRDGVVLQIGSASATYLPQVWEQLPDKVRFLSSLAQKAGCGADDWRKPGTRVLTYQVEAFQEAELKR